MRNLIEIADIIERYSAIEKQPENIINFVNNYQKQLFSEFDLSDLNDLTVYSRIILEYSIALFNQGDIARSNLHLKHVIDMFKNYEMSHKCNIESNHIYENALYLYAMILSNNDEQKEALKYTTRLIKLSTNPEYMELHNNCKYRMYSKYEVYLNITGVILLSVWIPAMFIKIPFNFTLLFFGLLLLTFSSAYGYIKRNGISKQNLTYYLKHSTMLTTIIVVSMIILTWIAYPGRMHYQISKLLDEWEQYQYSLAFKTEAISKDPSNSSYYNERGVAYFRLMQVDSALDDYNKSINLSKTSNTYNNRGLLYLYSGKADLAKDDFNEACKLGKCINQSRIASACSYLNNNCNINNSCFEYNSAKSEEICD